jgi:hypothetical protein
MQVARGDPALASTLYLSMPEELFIRPLNGDAGKGTTENVRSHNLKLKS